jgi:hypothetical protein
MGAWFRGRWMLPLTRLVLYNVLHSVPSLSIYPSHMAPGLCHCWSAPLCPSVIRRHKEKYGNTLGTSRTFAGPLDKALNGRLPFTLPRGRCRATAVKGGSPDTAMNGCRVRRAAVCSTSDATGNKSGFVVGSLQECNSETQCCPRNRVGLHVLCSPGITDISSTAA